MRPGIVASLTSALVVGTSALAWAHPVLRPDTADPGARLDPVLRVPSEVEGSQNTKITMFLAQGWTALECRSPVGWTCNLDSSTVTWSRLTNVTDGVTFDVAVAAPITPGTYPFPEVQELDNGSLHRWDADARADGTAPHLTVRSKGQGVTPPTQGLSPHPTPQSSRDNPTTVSNSPRFEPLPAAPSPTATTSELPRPRSDAQPAQPAFHSAQPTIMTLSPVTDHTDGAPSRMPALLAVGLLAAPGTAHVALRRRQA
jgi:hypothetical protein